MHLSIRVVALATLLAQVASKLLQVNVGQQGIAFAPDTIQASIGDTIQFSFYNNHSVVESSFASPCQPLSNGFYSGFIESCLNCGAAPQHFNLKVKDTNPHWFYCSQKGHCASGMVGMINPQLEAYAAGAANTNPNASPNDISPRHAPIGGIISSIATSTPTSHPDQPFTFALSGFNSVTPPASAPPPPNTTTTTTPSESVVIYTPNNETNSIVTGVNIIYEAGGTTPAAITTTVKGAAETSPRSTVTSVRVFSAGVASASSISATNTGAAPVASPSTGSAASSTLSGCGGRWLLLFVYLGVVLFAAW